MSEMPKVASALNHVAYVTQDTEATKRFYTEVLGFPLVAAVRGEFDPETNTDRPHIHTFFAMGGGEVIAFFEFKGEKPGKPDHMPTWARHFAMSVDSYDDILAWKKRLEENDVQTTDVVDHDGIWKSIYFMDPNQVLLEFTYQARELTDADAASAETMVAAWVAEKA